MDVGVRSDELDMGRIGELSHGCINGDEGGGLAPAGPIAGP